MAAASAASKTELSQHALLRPAPERQLRLYPAENEVTEEAIPMAPRMPSYGPAQH